MEAASRGARSRLGVDDRDPAGLRPRRGQRLGRARRSRPGSARGATRSSSPPRAGLVAVGGGYGTLSEIALALRAGKPVVGIGTWDVAGVEPVADAAAAVERISAQSRRSAVASCCAERGGPLSPRPRLACGHARLRSLHAASLWGLVGGRRRSSSAGARCCATRAVGGAASAGRGAPAGRPAPDRRRAAAGAARGRRHRRGAPARRLPAARPARACRRRVRRAGGATREADAAAVNLAAKVADGQQILVPGARAGRGAAPARPAGRGGPPGRSASTPRRPSSSTSSTASGRRRREDHRLADRQRRVLERRRPRRRSPASARRSSRRCARRSAP